MHATFVALAERSRSRSNASLVHGDATAVALRRQQPAMVEGRRLAGGAAEPAEPPIRHEFLHAALEAETERRPPPAHVRCQRVRAIQQTHALRIGIPIRPYARVHDMLPG